MSVSLTAQHRRLLKGLLRLGRWSDEDEIIRYGLYLVKKQVDAEELRPYPETEVRRALRQRSAEEHEEENRMARASARHYPKDLDA